MRLNELFNNAQVRWKWDYNSDSEAEATFMAGEVQYKFYAYSSEDGIWEVEFKIVNHEFTKSRYGITGTGNSSLVMSTVVSILKEFLQKYQGKVDKLIFSAAEQSRRDLYARMIRRLLPSWKFEQKVGDFTLTNPQL